MRRFLIISIFVLLSFSLLLPAYGKSGIPASKNGILDLTGWNFSKDGPVPMAGQWEFFWQTHVSPQASGQKSPTDHKPDSLIRAPGAWNGLHIKGKALPGQGIATFRLLLKLPPASHDLGLKFLDMATAFEVYLNGKIAFTSGNPGKTKQDTIPQYTPGVISIPANQLLPEMEILVHVSNFHHWQGGMWEVITIGNFNDLNRIREEKLFKNAILFGSIFIMGIYHVFLYQFRRKDRSPLYFGLFCLLIAIRPMTHGERYLLELLPDMVPFTLFLQLNYISFFFCVPLFAYYTLTLFPEQVSKNVIHGISFVSILASAITLIFPPHIFTAFMPYLQGATLIAVGYGAICVIQAVRLKKKGCRHFYHRLSAVCPDHFK